MWGKKGKEILGCGLWGVGREVAGKRLTRIVEDRRKTDNQQFISNP